MIFYHFTKADNPELVETIADKYFIIRNKADRIIQKGLLADNKKVSKIVSDFKLKAIH